MNKRFAVVTLAIILSVVLSMGVAVANPKYAITNLGPGGASGINDSGQVTGSTITPAGTHLFVYNGSVQDLDPAAMNSFGHDINSAGAIAGGDVDKGAFVYDGTFHWLGQGFSALGINDSGLVVGGSGGGASARATVYDGGWQDLATLGGTEGMCSGVNNAGLITGYSTTAEGYRHAFLYDGTIHDIGTLPGFSRSSGSAINASGIITGWSDNGDGTPGHVFVYDGTMHDLGTLPDSSWGEGCAINDAGTVVGYCRNSTSIASAFVYDESMQDLNSLIAPESGWVLQVAYGINNAGQISGMGTYNGETSGFLLTPLPEISIGSPSATTTSAGPVSFVVSYTGATSISLASDDVTVNSIGTASAGNIEVTGDGTATRTVTLSDIAGSGTLGISIAAGSALNIDAPAPAAGPSETFAVANVPGVTISAPSATVTKSGPVTYTVTYTDATAVNLTTAKISLIKTGTASGSLAVSGTGTTSRTVKISSMRGNGTLAISVAAGTASNESGSAPSAGPSDSFAVYTSAPKVTIGAPSVAATKSGPVTYTVTYTNAANVNLSTAKITLKRTGTANGTVAVSGEGISTRTITLSDTTGDGTLSVMIASGSATNIAGSANAIGSSAKVTIVNTRPKLTISNPSTKSTKVGPVSYTVSYTGATAITLSPADVTLNSTGTANGTISITGTDLKKRTIRISGITGDGTLGISIAAGSASNVGGPSDAAGPSTTFAVANTLPAVTIGAPSATTTRTGPVTIPLTYTGATSVSLSSGKVTLIRTGTAKGTVSVTGTSLESRTVTISAISGDGTLAIKIASGTAKNAAGSALAAGPSAVITVANSQPKVTIGAPSATATKTGPITYNVTYFGADAVTLSEADVTLNRTGTANGTVSVTGDTLTSRTVVISDITGDGTVGISIAAGTASNLAGLSAAAGSSATCSVVNTPPQITISAPSVASTRSGPVKYTVTYTGATSVSLNNLSVVLVKTGTANGTVAVTGTGTTTRTVTISGITGDGTLAIAIAAGTASNSAGFSGDAGPSDAFAVSNMVPRITISEPSMYLADANMGETVSYTVTYTGASSISLTAYNVVLNRTGTATGTVLVTGDGLTTRTITLYDIQGNGSLGISLSAGTASNAVGSAPVAGPSTPFTVVDPWEPPPPPPVFS